MKTNLTLELIKRDLKISVRPVYDTRGKVKYVPQAKPVPYIVFDTNRAAPVGFGVKVNATSKTFVLQRRVGKKVIKAKVGGVLDFPSIEAAREAARKKAEELLRLGANPNVVARKNAEKEATQADRLTVSDAFNLYRSYLANRADKPVKASSLKAIDNALRRLERPEIGLAGKILGSLTDKMVLSAFDTLASTPRQGTRKKDKPALTACEQTFRWATAAVNYVIEKEARQAMQERRLPSLQVNPLLVLKIEGRFRSKAQLEKDYKANQTRNPMVPGAGESLGKFIEAVWQRRNETPNNRTAADYLLLTLFWGMRRGEAAPLQWRDMLTKQEATVCSWVDLDTRTVHLHDTKNGTEHDLPIVDAAYEILARRHEDRDKKKGAWVFPARSSKAVSGHYKDSKSILKGVRETAGIDLLRTHDLRRTFGAIAEEVASYAVVKALLNHRRLDDVTERYTKPEMQRMKEAMTRIERVMLASAPSVELALVGHLNVEEQ